MVTRLNRKQIDFIARNSTSYEMVIADVMKRKNILEISSYIWTDVMSHSPINNSSVKIVRGDK